MPEPLLRNHQLAEDTIRWLEARLVQTARGPVFTLGACLTDLLWRCDTLSRPQRTSPDNPYLVMDVSFGSWDCDLSDGIHSIREALWGDEPQTDRETVVRRLNDPAPVAELMTALKLVASGYRKTREQLLGLSGGADAEPSATHKGELPPARHSARWQPPQGYVGTKTITSDQRFSKEGKNPQPSTIARWLARDKREAKAAGRKPVELDRDPANGEVYYPETWIMRQIQLWNPRKQLPTR